MASNTWFRYSMLTIVGLIQFIVYFIIILTQKYHIFGKPEGRKNLVLRCLFGTTVIVCIYSSYPLQPLSDTVTIFMSTPVFCTIFAYILLKEPITPLHVGTGVTILVGVVLTSRPEFLFGQKDPDKLYPHRTVGIVLSIAAAIASAMVYMWYYSSGGHMYGPTTYAYQRRHYDSHDVAGIRDNHGVHCIS
ncbi:unnamed protein product [Oppiella nova]|uniref:EamA domain-containing protein n=1 Tax=Oppiella nova TaxID=334625 RepID=A0A7R9M418_9ACAR|nr:unnamed protein product [Oppiella nova]CAG2169852.1 unnamed protein product [Oppiella nova]